MICFRDKSYCSDADQCANKEGCSSYFSPSEQRAAESWWGGSGAPVAFMSKKNHCKNWKQDEKH